MAGSTRAQWAEGFVEGQEMAVRTRSRAYENEGRYIGIGRRECQYMSMEPVKVHLKRVRGCIYLVCLAPSSYNTKSVPSIGWYACSIGL